MKSLEQAYELKAATEHGYHLFTTRYGVEYSIGVRDYSDWFGLPSQDFQNPMMYLGLDQLTHEIRAPFDPRIKATVVAFIVKHLDVNPEHVIWYICSALEGKEEQRKNLFAVWYHEQKNLTHIQKTIQILEDEEIHFLYRTDRSVVTKLIEQIETYPLLPGRLFIK